jgi:osmotically-inducible protein OsmY
MSDIELQESVREELFADPRIDHLAVAVSADQGVVTLRGTVGSLRQKREAGRAAKRVRGVLEVRNRLKVKLLIGDRCEDSELRGAVLQALALDSQLPSSIDANVDHGIVTLTGTVRWRFQREEAESVASNVRGVLGLKSRIVLIPMPSSIDVKEAIEQRFKRMASLEADRLTVETSGDTVILSGFVSSWEERDAAVDAAWSLPNVTEVKDRIEITYDDPGLD